ncbi:hypothetical protein MDA_GLEAN10023695 [Myotis davidii]|uniref:Uncharacterized protein n=1 Tax=Myotis davidii TaxID=225400 RepID=L5M6Q7_MYODS|nr:hypothetical protein MDA_GLEAN10023695 [Myotis davidii]
MAKVAKDLNPGVQKAPVSGWESLENNGLPGLGGGWLRSRDNSSRVSGELALLRGRSQRGDWTPADVESKPLLAQAHISFKFLVLDEYLYPNRASGKVPSGWILRVLPLLSSVDQTQESGGIFAKYTLFEV